MHNNVYDPFKSYSAKMIFEQFQMGEDEFNWEDDRFIGRGAAL